MVKKLIDFLKKEYFPNGWFNQTLFKENPYDFLSIFELKIVNSGKEISEFYTNILLSGDYINLTLEDLKKSKKELEDFFLKVSSEIEIINTIEGSDEYDIEFTEYTGIFQSAYSEKLIEIIDLIIYQNIVNLVIDLNLQFKLDNKYKLVSKNNIEIPNIEDQSYRNHLRAYIIALKICRLEHFEYKYTKETVQVINSFWHEVNEITKINNNDIFKVLFIKIDFLFKKFLYRNKLEKKEKRNVQFFVDLDSSDEISLEKFNEGGNFQNWENRLQIHYEINDSWEQRIRSLENELFRLSPSNHTQQDFHLLTKSYKDIHKNSDRLKRLYSEFIDKFRNNLSKDFEIYSFNVSAGYIFNNYLSCKLFSNEYSIELVKSFKSELIDNQNSTGILNFFPWKVLGQKIISRLEVLSKELFIDKNYIEFEENISLLNDVIFRLEESFEWSLGKNYLPFQYSHKFCLSDFQFLNKIKEEQQNLFLFTSYFLPSNYSYFEIVKNEIKNKKLKLEALGEFYHSIQSIVVEVKTNSDKVNNTERRSIETLAIFSAVALFSIGSIQIFSFKSVALDPFLFYNFILSFGYSLAIFVLLIWIITSKHSLKLEFIIFWY